MEIGERWRGERDEEGREMERGERGRECQRGGGESEGGVREGGERQR